MTQPLEELKQTWHSLGRDDPFWAIASHADKQNGKWNLEAFFQTGEDDVHHYHELLMAHAGAPSRFEQVLDFGCGVGRLTRAWGRRAAFVTGVDIASSMIERGRVLLANQTNLRLVLNQQDRLIAFADEQFDLVFSHLCLQHMPWVLAANYLREFARVCRPDGWVAFQLPTRQLRSSWLPTARKRLVDALPFGWGRRYRRWRHGRETVFEMHFTPAAEVEAAARRAGLRLVHLEPDLSAGAGTEGFIYLFRRPAGH